MVNSTGYYIDLVEALAANQHHQVLFCPTLACDLALFMYHISVVDNIHCSLALALVL